MPDDDDRWEPMNFYSSAEDYYGSAVCIVEACRDGKLLLNFSVSVPYYLFSHAVELALKGFLRAKGIKKDVLKNKYGHKSLELLKDSISHGLPLDGAERGEAARWLEEYDRESLNFRFIRPGLISLTDIKTTKSNAERILSVVRPTCQQARDKRR